MTGSAIYNLSAEILVKTSPGESGTGRKDNTPPLPNTVFWSAYSYPLYKLEAQRVLSSVQHSMK